MKRNFAIKFASLLILLAVIGGLLIVNPSRVALARVVEEYYDYCIVSGSTAPSAANGTYLFYGTSNGYPVYKMGDYSISYQDLAVWSGSRFPTLSVPLLADSYSLWFIAGANDGDYAVYFLNSSLEGTYINFNNETANVTCGFETPSDPPTPEPTKSPITYVFGDGRQVNLSCQKTRSFGLIVPGGDMALLSCPISGLGTNTKLTQDKLPAGVTGGTFVAGFDLEINGGGAPLSILPTPYIVAFKIPEGVSADKLAILYWDAANNKWVELPTAVNLLTDKVTDFGNGRKVIVGTHQYTRTHVSATVNFTGIFVLIQK